MANATEAALRWTIRAAFALSVDEELSSLASSEGVVHEGGVDMTWVNSKPLIYAACMCSVISCFVSFVDLREHLSRLDYPKLQVLEMRIIAMIPIYAVFSAMSLLFRQWRFFLVTVRDTYESFVLYIFFMLMIAYCGGEGQLLRSLKRKRYVGVHPFPLCCIPHYALDTAFYLRCKRWVLQCALIKPVTSFIALVTNPFGIYQEGTFAVNNVYTYNCIIINFSLTWSLYYLVLFEIECGKEMHYAKTFLKFLCIKSIIFFSYWQSVMVSLAASSGLLYMGASEHDEEVTSATIQDLLMCFELLPVAFLHRAAFGRDKLDEEMAAVPMYMKDNNTSDLRSNMDTALNVNDVIDDTLGTIFYRRGKLMDQENAEDTDDDFFAIDGNKDDGAQRANGNEPDAVLDGLFDRDPTLDELVQHAVTSDYGVRVDGALHYDEDSDREERNTDMNYADTDVILHRVRHEDEQEARVDIDVLRSNQIKDGSGSPQMYCVVCGRYDREMVRRRNGYKCKECVGTKSQSLLRRRQREVEPEAGAPGSASAKHNDEHDGNAAVVIETLPLDVQESGRVRGGDTSGTAATAGDDDGGYVQPVAEPDADLGGRTAPRDASAVAALLRDNPATAAITQGFANFNNLLRNTLTSSNEEPVSSGLPPAVVDSAPPANANADRV